MKKLLLIALLLVALVVTLVACNPSTGDTETDTETPEVTADETEAPTADPGSDTEAPTETETETETEAPVKDTETEAPTETETETDPPAPVDPDAPVKVLGVDELAAAVGLNEMEIATGEGFVTYTYVPGATGANDPYGSLAAGYDGSRFLAVKYRAPELSAGMNMQVYVGSGQIANDDQSLQQAIIADGEWHILIFDLDQLVTKVEDYYVNFLRFDALQAGIKYNEDGTPVVPDPARPTTYEKLPIPDGASIDVEYIAFFNSESAALKYYAAPLAVFTPEDIANTTPNNDVVATLGNGFVSLTGAGGNGDGWIHLLSGAGLKGTYVALKYRTTSVDGAEFFVGSTGAPHGATDQAPITYVADGNWHLAIVDVSTVQDVDGIVDYLRYDFFFNATDKVVDVAYIAVFASEAQALAYEATVLDPGTEPDSSIDFNSDEEQDLSTIFTFGAGAAPDDFKYTVAPYNFGGINQLTLTMDGAYALLLKNTFAQNAHAAGFVRGVSTPNFGDPNYYGSDKHDDPNGADGSVGCAGIYFGVITVDGKPVLRLNVKGQTADGASNPHIYLIPMANSDLAITDNGSVVTFLNGTTVLATVTLSGDADGYATQAIVALLDGTTETLDDICAAATIYSDIGFVARAATFKMDALRLMPLSAFVPESVFVKPTEPADIVDAAYGLAEGETLAEGPYTLTGVITSIDEVYSTKYNNITVTIEVAGKAIKCYRLQGEGTDDLIVGDTITVTGELTNYNGTIEFAAKCNLDAADRIERPVVEVPDVSIDFVEANRTEGTTDKNVYVSNGITLINNKAGSSSDCRQDADHVRLYAKSEVIISYPGMLKLVFTCTGGKNITEALVADVAGTWEIEGNVATLTLAKAANKITFASLPAQIRLTSIGIFAGEPAPEMWDVAKDIVTHQSFDELRINNGAGAVFTPGASAGWDKIANLDSNAVNLQYWGWVGIKADTVGTFGYQINDGDIVYDAGYAVTAEQGVLDAAAPTGAATASRMLITIDVENLIGENTVTIYYKTADGKATILNVFTVIKPVPLTFVLGDNAAEVEANGEVAAEFYAKVDGTYVLTWAEGETNGYIAIEIGNETFTFEPSDAPIEFTLAAGQAAKLVVMTYDYAADEVNFVISPKEEEVQNPVAVLGDNKADIAANGEAALEFYAKVDGTYVLTWAEGETNGYIAVEIGNETFTFEPSDASAEFTLAAGQAAKLVVMTYDYAADEINFVISPKEEEVQNPVAVLGDNKADIAANGEVALEFSAEGAYVLTWAEGETNGYIAIEIGNETFTFEPADASFEFTLAAGQVAKLVVMTYDYAADEINFVISAKAAEPAYVSPYKDLTTAEVAALDLGWNHLSHISPDEVQGGSGAIGGDAEKKHNTTVAVGTTIKFWGWLAARGSDFAGLSISVNGVKTACDASALVTPEFGDQGIGDYYTRMLAPVTFAEAGYYDVILWADFADGTSEMAWILRVTVE